MSNINAEENGIRWFPRASNLLENLFYQTGNAGRSGKSGDDISIACRYFGKRNQPDNTPAPFPLPHRTMSLPLLLAVCAAVVALWAMLGMPHSRDCGPQATPWWKEVCGDAQP